MWRSTRSPRSRPTACWRWWSSSRRSAWRSTRPSWRCATGWYTGKRSKPTTSERSGPRETHRLVGFPDLHARCTNSRRCAGGRATADPFRPRLRRRGAGLLMSARPDLTPNQGTRYQLKQIPFQANPERFQAYLAGELDAGTAPGLAVIFARAQGVDMKIVASVCLEAAGKERFSTTYMAKDDVPDRPVKH